MRPPRPFGQMSIDKETLAAMRLSKAVDALRDGRAGEAMLEAEELLDEHPSHVEALLVVAEATLAMGDAGTAREAFHHLTQLLPEDPSVASGLAVAHYEFTDFDGCAAAATQAVALDPRRAEAWYYLALTRERKGDLTDAREAFAKAESLMPEAFPLPVERTEEQWTDATAKALARLDGELARFYARVPVTLEEYPTIEELRVVDPPLSPFAPALYTGEPDPDGDPWKVLPDQVRLYRANLDRPPAANESVLAERIAAALTSEAEDWLGEDEAE